MDCQSPSSPDGAEGGQNAGLTFSLEEPLSTVWAPVNLGSGDAETLGICQLSVETWAAAVERMPVMLSVFVFPNSWSLELETSRALYLVSSCSVISHQDGKYMR